MIRTRRTRSSPCWTSRRGSPRKAARCGWAPSPASWSWGRKTARLYGAFVVKERHRHRYEFNNAYRERFEKAGFIFSGFTPDGKLVEIIELPDHPFFIASQFHPEFHSKPHQPHPLFRGFIAAALVRALPEALGAALVSVIQPIAQKASEAGLPFLVIGGYAVMAHGFVRATDDLDLLVQGSRRDHWRRLLEGLGMGVYREGPVFMQFDPPRGGCLPVDLMFVTDEIFDRMQAVAEPASVEGASFGVVSLLHLIALKCHAIRHGKPLRRIKDTDDLIHLVIINCLDLNEPELRATILKHGDAELYEKLQKACASE